MRWAKVKNLTTYTLSDGEFYLEPNGQSNDTKWVPYDNAVEMARNNTTGDIDTTKLQVIKITSTGGDLEVDTDLLESKVDTTNTKLDIQGRYHQYQAGFY